MESFGIVRRTIWSVLGCAWSSPDLHGTFSDAYRITSQNSLPISSTGSLEADLAHLSVCILPSAFKERDASVQNAMWPPLVNILQSILLELHYGL